jgi:PAS domain S-box-containing protein
MLGMVFPLLLLLVGAIALWRWSIQHYLRQWQQAELALQQLNQELEARVEQRTAALRQTEARFQRLAANMPGVIYQYLSRADGTDAFTYMGPGCRELYELEPEQIEANAALVWEAVYPDDLESLQRSVAAATQAFSPWSWEGRIVAVSGQVKWIRALARPERQPNGDILWDGLMVDISDRKQAEEELRQAVTTNQAILHAIPDLIFRMGRDGTFKDGIPSPEVPLLRPLEDLIGKNMWEVLPADLAQQRMAAIERAFQTGATQIYEHQIQVQGELRYEELRVVVYEEDEVLVLIRDITDRKRSELALQDSEERLRLAIRSANQGLYDLDLTTGIAIVSPEYATMLGYDPTEFWETNARWIERLHPDDHDRVVNVFHAYVRGDLAEYKVEFRQRIRSGDWKWILSLGKIVAWDETGQPLRMLGTHTDISDRKQAEDALRESETRFRQMAENIQEVFWMVDIDFREVLYISPAYEEIWGRSRPSVYGDIEAFTASIHPNDQARVAAILEQQRHQGWEIEYRILRPDGSLRWIWEQAFPVLDSVGTVHRIVGICQDITKRKQAELEIRHLNQILEAQNQNLEALVAQRTSELLTFMNALPDCVYVIRREDMQVLFCNDQFVTMVGLGDRPRVESKSIFEIFSADLAALFSAQNQQVFVTGETLHVQEFLQLPAGSFHLDTYKIPLKHPNGEVYALIGSSRDITELVEARQALTERTIQLEASNQELESFSYSVSHDLRAPLRHMSGFVHALKQRLIHHEALIDPRVAHYIDVVETSSQKMALLIDGLLLLSRVGRKPMAQEPVSLRKLVHEAINLIRGNPDWSETLEVVIGDLPTVQGDATLLQQVLVNLISNAVKFSRNVPQPRVEIGSLPEGTLFVRDNGVGFQMEYADKLFGAFQRLHSQSTFEGTGIGLAIVQRIIHRHGGTIWAESEPNQGTTFYFTVGHPQSQHSV